MQMANMAAMQNADLAKYANAYQTTDYRAFLGKSIPDKPLDERFSDFKVKLAKALAKRH